MTLECVSYWGQGRRQEFSQAAWFPEDETLAARKARQRLPGSRTSTPSDSHSFQPIFAEYVLWGRHGTAATDKMGTAGRREELDGRKTLRSGAWWPDRTTL